MESLSTSIPLGLCQCGCGQKTHLARLTDNRRGSDRGTPNKFLQGHNKRKSPLDARFWTYGCRHPLTGCLEWQRRRDSNGYGRIWSEGHEELAHRVAWKLTNGPIPDGLFVCHKCDNPPCFDPEHLFLGTQTDNVRDAAQKGRLVSGDRHPARLYPDFVKRGDDHPARLHPERMARGSQHGNAVLTESQVLAIRQEYQFRKMSYRALALKYGVGETTIASIIRRKYWQHI